MLLDSTDYRLNHLCVVQSVWLNASSQILRDLYHDSKCECEQLWNGNEKKKHWYISVNSSEAHELRMNIFGELIDWPHESY